jgi:alkylglycerol monooxygenase
MNQFGNALLIAMPGFFVLIMFEMFWGRWKHNEQQPLIDAVASVACGFTNILKATLGLTIVIFSYAWMESHLHVIQLSASSAVDVYHYLCCPRFYWLLDASVESPR